jgi:hypothetical protein
MNLRLAVAIAAIPAFALGGWAMAASKLLSIFKFDMLNARVAYLESITGPAMHIYSFPDLEIREYRVNGCNVQAFVGGAEVKRYSLMLTPRCNFNFNAFWEKICQQAALLSANSPADSTARKCVSKLIVYTRVAMLPTRELISFGTCR